MIARLTRFVILLQLITLAGLSTLFFSLGWIDSFAISLLCAAAILTLMRAGIIFNNFKIVFFSDNI